MNGARFNYVVRVLAAAVLNRRSRLLLVIAALALVATLVTTLVAVSVGASQQLGEGLKMFGANVVVAPPVVATGSGQLDTGSYEQVFDAQVVADAATGLPGVQSITLRVDLPQRVGAVDTRLIGIPPADLQAATWRLDGALPAAGQALLGRDLATQLGVGIGGTVEAGGAARTVAGIVESGAAEDDAVIVPIEDALTLTGGGVSTVLVRVEPAQVDAVVAQLAQRIPGLEVRTLRQVADSEGRLLDRVRVLLLIVTVGVALSAAIAVGTTLNLVVLERGPEIGLLKALGGTSRLVVGYFMLEQISSAMLAGLIGLVLGMAAAEAVSYSVFGTWLPFTLQALPAGFGVAVAIVLVAGAIPVARAARVESAEALRGL